jgi:hypothetical protein
MMSTLVGTFHNSRYADEPFQLTREIEPKSRKT